MSLFVCMIGILLSFIVIISSHRDTLFGKFCGLIIYGAAGYAMGQWITMAMTAAQ